LETRKLVLQQAGFIVHSATDLAELEQLAATTPIDLFLLCHEFTHEKCQDAVRMVEQICPQPRILIMRAGGDWGETWLSHPVMNSIGGPRALLAAVRRTLGLPPETSPPSATPINNR
jgi:hypothetical protein